MSILSGLKKKAAPTTPDKPKVRTEAKPVDINPTIHKGNVRQASRLERLYSTTLTAEIEEAIEVCKARLRVNSVPNIPRNAGEARTLINKLNKGS